MKNIAESLKQVNECYEKKAYKEALKCLNTILEQDANNGDALYLKGMSLSRQGDNVNAIEYLEKVPETNEHYHAALFRLGMLQHRILEYYDVALQTLHKIPSTADNYYDALLEIAIIHTGNDEHDQALKCLHIVPETSNKYGNVLHSIADIHYKTGDTEKMFAAYNKVPLHDECYGKAQISKSRKLEESCDIEGTLKCLASIPATDQYYFRSLKDRTDILKENGRSNEVLAIWETITPESEYYGEGLIQQGLIYGENKDYTKALELFNAVPVLSDNYLTALKFIGETYHFMENENESLKYKKWFQIVEEQWHYEGRVSSLLKSLIITNEEKLAYWDTIPATNKYYYHAMLYKVFIYKSDEEFAKGLAIFNTIPEEAQKELNKIYDMPAIYAQLNV